MIRQRLLRALVIWVVLVLIPVALIVTGRAPRMSSWVGNVLSVLSLAATLVLCFYVLRGRDARR
jgi:uncharacterized membrane protein YdjX (TVP38/TMEM64 family)